MLRKSFCIVIVACLAGCSDGAPSSSQVKQALFEHYETANASDELKRALENEVAVSDCQKYASGYRCEIENKALNTSTEMMFVLDKSDGKWKLKDERS